jgi:hypothetical protein
MISPLISPLDTATIDYDSRVQARHIFRLAAMTEKPISVAESLQTGKTEHDAGSKPNGINGHIVKSTSIPIARLNTGAKMPMLGFGTFAKEGIEGLTHKAVIAALDAGYRHLDCAWYYLNEDEVGTSLREWLSANPSVKRSDIFITTKVWPHMMEPEDVEWTLNNSLEKLGLDYVDAYLIHWPFAAEKTENNKPKLGTDGKVCDSWDTHNLIC